MSVNLEQLATYVDHLARTVAALDEESRARKTALQVGLGSKTPQVACHGCGCVIVRDHPKTKGIETLTDGATNEDIMVRLSEVLETRYFCGRCDAPAVLDYRKMQEDMLACFWERVHARLNSSRKSNCFFTLYGPTMRDRHHELAESDFFEFDTAEELHGHPDIQRAAKCGYTKIHPWGKELGVFGAGRPGYKIGILRTYQGIDFEQPLLVK